MFAHSLAALLASAGTPPVTGFHLRIGLTGYLIIGILLSRYVRAPLALYRMSNAAFNPRIRLVSADEALDPNVRASIEQTERALLSAGFAGPERITVSAQAPLTGVETLCEHLATGDLANVVAMLNPRATTMSPLVTSVTFRSAFADGTLLQTSNTTNAGYWPDQPTHSNVVIPDVRDPLELYRLHRARVGRKTASVAQSPLTRGTTPEQRLAYATRQNEDSTNFLIARGYRKRSPSGVRLTALGATLTAWRRLFPWKHLGERQRRRAAAEVVRLA